MGLPFTAEEFLGIFRDYNQTLWPAQLLLLCLALVAIVFLVRSRRWSGAGVSGILAFLWAWLAVAYHLAFFTRINPLAYVFAAISMVGALVFLWQGVIRRRLRFVLVRGGRFVVGAVLIMFALMVYPAWSWYAGYRYPAMPTFGLPCPTTLFTVGLFAFVEAPYPRSPLVIPVLWCFVGAQAAFLLSVPQDHGLIIAGVVGLVLLTRSRVSAASAGAVSGGESHR